jgi:hypothetical protein
MVQNKKDDKTTASKWNDKVRRRLCTEAWHNIRFAELMYIILVLLQILQKMAKTSMFGQIVSGPGRILNFVAKSDPG